MSPALTNASQHPSVGKRGAARELLARSRVVPGMRAVFVGVMLAACTPAASTPEPSERKAEAAPEPEAKPIRMRVETGELVLRRTHCYGDCPSYTVLVDADGLVFYHGRDFAERRGLHTGTVALADVQELFGLALDGGYFDTEHMYEEKITDHATIYTSVLADGRRHWVRNYAKAAPEIVLEVELGIDALLAKTQWHATPRREPLEAGEACRDLGRAIQQRCGDVLRVRATGGDCGYWFVVWDELGEHSSAEPHTPERCARHLRSLASAPAPALTPQRELAIGPECGAWVDLLARRCERDLLEGPLGGCRRVGDDLERIITQVTAAEDPQMRSVAEAHCRTFRPGPDD